MRPTKICIYGGTDLQGAPIPFISALAYEILQAMPAVIVTGGFLHSNQKPAAVSTDSAALDGARRFAAETGRDLEGCYEAWIPEPSLDSRSDVRGAKRMTRADGVTVRVMTGRTPLGRRLAMVADVDMVVTISGKVHTEVVVEQALELGVPVLPIPNAGGDSKELLDNYRKKIAASFEAGALDKCLEEVSRTIADQPHEAAQAVVELIKTAKLGSCLVLLPYDARHDEVYAEIIEPAVEKHMTAIRLDHAARSDAIYTSFATAMRSSSAVIADVTQLNANVMYEIGYAHGRGLAPLLYADNVVRPEELPVYFRTLHVRFASEATPLSALIDEYLSSFKAGRRIRRNT
jgi:hypothetical protein